MADEERTREQISKERERERRERAKARAQAKREDKAGRRAAVRETERPRERRPQKRGAVNYRLIGLGFVAVLLLVCIILGIVVRVRGGKIRDLQEQVETLTAQVEQQNVAVAGLQNQVDALYQAAMSALPAPTTANTQQLDALIPQLTDGVCIVALRGGKYQYLRIPAGILADKLTAFRDSNGYVDDASVAAEWDTWVLFDDTVIGMKRGAADVGMRSADRSAKGEACRLPAGFTDFVGQLVP